MAESEKTTTEPAQVKRVAGISAFDAREKGELAVEEGALDRAEAHAASSAYPTAKPDEVDRIYVTPDGKAHDAAPEGGSIQLTGAEARAYKAKHGSTDKDAAPVTPAKGAEQKPNKSRRKTADKAK